MRELTVHAPGLAAPAARGATDEPRRLHVALVTSQWGPPWVEGVRNLARRLVAFLEARGTRVTIVAPRRGRHDRLLGPTARRLHLLTSGRFLITAALDARRAGADTVLMLASASPLLGVRSWLLHRATGRPVVIYITGRRSMVTGCRTLLRARTVAVNAPVLASLFPGATVVPPFVDPDRLGAGERTGRSERPVILFLGAFERCRGVEVLIEAMSHLPARLNASLVLAWNGVGWQRAASIVRTIGANRSPHTISLVQGADVARLYAQASVMVIPRLTPERMAFPVRIVEAIATSTPLIVTTVNGMDGLVEGCGLAVPPGDARALAAALERLLTDDDLYRRLVAGCREKARMLDSDRSLDMLYRTLAAAVA
ncbi:MAG TPA: glycosyltransferase family 4 protein [Candidatus Tectomicrobia bacterium]|nr:glycosyltransferase family 4 protein [Candidatus Tectomicrobia bacterium]